MSKLYDLLTNCYPNAYKNNIKSDVPKNINDTDLQKRYRQIIAENHPDKLTAAGMSVEFVQMANGRLARINDAYQRIVAIRQQQNAMTAAQQ